MSNVFRAGELGQSAAPVRIPLRSGVEPAKAEAGERGRLEIQARMIQEAKYHTRKVRAEIEELTKAAAAEAEAVVLKAREQATAIVAGARKEEERITAEARGRGLARAREEAKAEAMRLVEATLAAVKAAAVEVKGRRQLFLRAAARSMVEIIRAVLEKLLRGRVTVDRGLVLRTLDAAVAEITAADRITVRLHPDDLGAATEFRDEILRRIEGLTDVTLTPDPGVARGGVLVETAFGRVDARLETQLQEILREAEITVAEAPAESLEPQVRPTPSSPPSGGEG